MTLLIMGLVVFLGVHSLNLLLPEWRSKQVRRLGEGTWKSLYSLASVIGLALIIWGFGLARQHPLVIYSPPSWMRHLTALFTLAAFILITAAYVPRNHFKQRVGHPMLAGVTLWALGHLLVIGQIQDLLLFGGFFIWAFADLLVSRARDRRLQLVYATGLRWNTVLACFIGVGLWAFVAFWLHVRMTGVSPFG